MPVPIREVSRTGLRKRKAEAANEERGIKPWRFYQSCVNQKGVPSKTLTGNGLVCPHAPSFFIEFFQTLYPAYHIKCKNSFNRFHNRNFLSLFRRFLLIFSPYFIFKVWGLRQKKEIDA
jgi:hypothetical protein